MPPALSKRLILSLATIAIFLVITWLSESIFLGLFIGLVALAILAHVPLPGRPRTATARYKKPRKTEARLRVFASRKF